MPNNKSAYEGLAERMRHLRYALGGGDAPTKWVKRLGLGPTAWQNYEAGTRDPLIAKAIIICNKTGASLDWIYRGDAFEHTLQAHVRDALAATPRASLPQRDRSGKLGRPPKKSLRAT